MKSVMVSIQPKWCELIASGKKTIEVRKTRPKMDTPFKCYIYETKDEHFRHIGYCWEPGKTFEHCIGKVVGEFVCDDIDWHNLSSLLVREDAENTLMGTCLTKQEVFKYVGYKRGTYIYAKPYEFYSWHISNLLIYDKPKELMDFVSGNSTLEITTDNALKWSGMKRPPQSWCYVEEGGEQDEAD